MVATLKQKGSVVNASMASLGLRCGAFLIDYILTLLIPAVTLILAVYIKRQWFANTFAFVLVIIGYLATAALIYFNLIYFYVHNGQSLGKSFIGLRVVRQDGAPIDYRTAIIRHVVGYPLSVICLGMGFLWMFWDQKQQGWHDKLAKTLVIKD